MEPSPKWPGGILGAVWVVVTMPFVLLFYVISPVLVLWHYTDPVIAIVVGGALMPCTVLYAVISGSEYTKRKKDLL